jgi:hypothetical protein
MAPGMAQFVTRCAVPDLWRGQGGRSCGACLTPTSSRRSMPVTSTSRSADASSRKRNRSFDVAHVVAHSVTIGPATSRTPTVSWTAWRRRASPPVSSTRPNGVANRSPAIAQAIPITSRPRCTGSKTHHRSDPRKPDDPRWLAAQNAAPERRRWSRHNPPRTACSCKCNLQCPVDSGPVRRGTGTLSGEP